MLAVFRYMTVCLERTSRFHQRITEVVDMKFFIFILASILIPSIAWTLIMYFGNPAAGNVWYFKPTPNSTDPSSITVFQRLPDKVRGEIIPIVAAMGTYLLLQLIVTLLLYANICYKSYMSTLKLALKKDEEEDSFPGKNKRPTTTSKQKNNAHVLKPWYDTDTMIQQTAMEAVPSKRRVKH